MRGTVMHSGGGGLDSKLLLRRLKAFGLTVEKDLVKACGFDLTGPWGVALPYPKVAAHAQVERLKGPLSGFATWMWTRL
ncbi:hypothetical protein TIFTF001_009692 [Ficus carica]|uniref:Uncharacterized protein n=1 Tax=Ficus carica TaxID=3494 RepID=A0AA88CZ61_FICCA|nr:hypothetical protein TIFTF001_009692 [Ficus carica]